MCLDVVFKGEDSGTNESGVILASCPLAPRFGPYFALGPRHRGCDDWQEKEEKGRISVLISWTCFCQWSS